MRQETNGHISEWSASMYRIAFLVSLLALIAAYSFRAEAQHSCPSGYYPVGGGNSGWSGCALMGTESGTSQQDFTPVPSGPAWATRWGAIAVDNVAGIYGGAEGSDSKGGAKKAAIADCKNYGGKKCKISILYYNQCGALASGDTYSITTRGPQLEETTARAVKLCSEHTKNCKPYYGGCSYPQRVR
ncbi:DUF4189 domain-containing protein [Novosphingobium sp.]|uniref:DUF4189 domain-containing protein n=1 Tax=Novosphingobium sp. TaxID=1874826 RepID=UPI0025D5BED8|nr:DUF4189 domain-containing protein [Novosphingobium sp.]